MEATERAVVRLTEEHTEMTEAGATEWPPLLSWLRERITDINQRGNGSGGQGIPINNDALEVLNFIERRYRLLCDAAYLGYSHDLVAGVKEVWRVLRAERAGGRIDDHQWENIEAEFPDWVARIEGEQERPRKMELTVPCPRCETRWVLDELERRVAAVVVEFAPGRAPVAECRVEECATIWAGWPEVAKLGFTVGAEQDRLILEACGIDTPEIGITTV